MYSRNVSLHARTTRTNSRFGSKKYDSKMTLVHDRTRGVRSRTTRTKSADFLSGESGRAFRQYARCLCVKGGKFPTSFAP